MEWRGVGAVLLGILLWGASSTAQDSDDLASKAQNPIGSMISLPFESNFNFENGNEDDDLQYVLSIQPVIPVGIAENWNLVVRPIVPLISQKSSAQLPFPAVVSNIRESTFGLGDSTLSLFLVPKEMKNGFVWGVGPVFGLPTATDDKLGAKKWSAGPTAVAVYKTGPWMLGTLVGQLWSFAGQSSRPDVSTFYVQPFVNYNLPDGWYLTSSPLMRANWKADSGQKWTVPLGGGVGKIFNIGSQAMNTRIVANYVVERPDKTADWTIQWTLQFLFPK